MLRWVTRALFYVSIFGGAMFLGTYEFPSIVGFAEFPFGPGLTREVLLQNLLVGAILTASVWGIWQLSKRASSPSNAETIRNLAVSTGIWVIAYAWSPIGRTVWGDPFGPSSMLTYATVLLSAGLYILGTLRKPPFGGVISMVAVLIAVWLKPDMSLDRLVLALIVTLGVTIWASHQALASRSVALGAPRLES